jgi:hypothetical protein
VLHEAVLDSSDVSSGELVDSLPHVHIFGSDWRYGPHRFLLVSLAQRVRFVRRCTSCRSGHEARIDETLLEERWRYDPMILKAPEKGQCVFFIFSLYTLPPK